MSHGFSATTGFKHRLRDCRNGSKADRQLNDPYGSKAGCPLSEGHGCKADIQIDERRADFDRVKWGRHGVVRKKEHEQDESLIQMWFAGNHSDIGGSYPENESRLSDIALHWMIEQVTSKDISHQLAIDRTQLKLYPSAAGQQHCEIDGFANAHPWIAKRKNWATVVREVKQGVTLHPAVAERIALPAVLHCGRLAPYHRQRLPTTRGSQPSSRRTEADPKGMRANVTDPAPPRKSASCQERR
ncbi:MAG: DUF2235 domain-containing protein [Pseudomonadota bacterium]